LEATYRHFQDFPFHNFSRESFQKEWPNYLGFILRQLGHASIRSAPAALPAFTISGVAGFPPVSAGKRPTITRGLALSGLSFFEFFS
jgi:hypothetical protein